jgi:hypothetical protein
MHLDYVSMLMRSSGSLEFLILPKWLTARSSSFSYQIDHQPEERAFHSTVNQEEIWRVGAIDCLESTHEVSVRLMVLEVAPRQPAFMRGILIIEVSLKVTLTSLCWTHPLFFSLKIWVLIISVLVEEVSYFSVGPPPHYW